jgi:hypothetical protein
MSLFTLYLVIGLTDVCRFISSEDDYGTEFPGVMIEVVDFVLHSPSVR